MDLDEPTGHNNVYVYSGRRSLVACARWKNLGI